MKKSFMTRALATGLSLAMAFSLTAATNVTSASAAAKKPTMVTYAGASAKSLDVKVGETVKIKVNAATKKNYKVSAVKVSSAKIAAKTNKAGTVVAITGKTATPEGKTASVKVSFKAKKTGKTSKYSYVSKVSVIEDKLTMTAEATHANEIAATFSKAVASDAKVTLKKGSSDVAATTKIADDGKSATLTLTGKLSEGTYTVTVVAGDETATADITAKNETLTSFEIGSTLKEEIKADSANSNKATAKISYQALNQYGDKINYTAEKTSVTVSIGTVKEVKACKTSESGTITVEDIPSMYAIPGQSFTVVIVDTVNNTGVTLNKTAVYGASATATDFASAGVYSTAKSAFKDIADGDKVADYELLFTAKDQYGDDMGAKDVATLASNGAIQVTIAGGLTNVKANDTYKDRTLTANVVEINDKTYFAVPFTAANTTSDKANAGTYSVTIVNNTKGIVYTGDYTVTSGTVIASIQLNPKDTIYADQDNELDYVITDTDGKEVTAYSTLKDIEIKGNVTGDKFSWKQNSNGTAKLIYKPAAMAAATSGRDYTKSDIRACTITANKAESGKLIVKSQTFSVYYQRTPLSVTGLASNATSVTTSGDLDVELKNLVVLDQYQNPYSESDLKNGYDTIGKDIYVSTKSAISSPTTVKIGTNDVATGVQAMAKKVEIKSISDKVKLNFVVSNAAVNLTKSSKDGVDVTFTKGDATKVSGLYVDSVNGGCALRADGVLQTAFLAKSNGDDNAKTQGEKYNNYGAVVVKGTVNGKKVVINPSQYAFVGANSSGELELDGVQSYSLAQKVITETREFSIVVSTADGAQTITGKVDVSNAPSTAKTISAKDSATTDYTVAATDAKSTNGVFKLASADALFTMKDQYNAIVSGSELLTYTVESVTVSGSGVKYDNEAVADKAELKASVLSPYLNGSNNNYLTLDSKVTGSIGNAIIAKVVVEGAIKGESSTASKTITLTITF